MSGKPPGQPVKRFVSGGCDNAVKVALNPNPKAPKP